MSREGAGDKRPTTSPAAPTPGWVWAIYVLGIVAAVILGISLLLALATRLVSDDIATDDSLVSPLRVLWVVLVLAAVVTWIVRRRQR